MAKLGKGTLFSVEQAFVGREEIRAPLKTPAWEATHDEEYENFPKERNFFSLPFDDKGDQ